MTATSIPLLQVDAFTSDAFSGNPAAVCLLPAAREAAWMHLVAREMNLPETAFVSPSTTDAGAFDLRWFTPAVEVNLCGHATLAAAHALWQTSTLALDATARFHTKSGLLTAMRTGDWIQLDFPATRDEPADAPAGLADALGVTPQYARPQPLRLSRAGRPRIGRPRDGARHRGAPDVPPFAVSSSPAGPRRPAGISSRGFSLLRQRFDEDRVTGFAHCCLTPFWIAPREDIDGRPSGVRSRWHRARSTGRRSGEARRAGGVRATGRASA